MKPEPLKNKGFNLYYIGKNNKDNFVYNHKDIKSAVEWLKKRMEKCNPYAYSFFHKIIDKAFEDVMEK